MGVDQHLAAWTTDHPTNRSQYERLHDCVRLWLWCSPPSTSSSTLQTSPTTPPSATSTSSECLWEKWPGIQDGYQGLCQLEWTQPATADDHQIPEENISLGQLQITSTWWGDWGPWECVGQGQVQAQLTDPESELYPGMSSRLHRGSEGQKDAGQADIHHGQHLSPIMTPSAADSSTCDVRRRGTTGPSSLLLSGSKPALPESCCSHYRHFTSCNIIYIHNSVTGNCYMFLYLYISLTCSMSLPLSLYIKIFLVHAYLQYYLYST